MIHDGLWCSFEQCHMGNAGEMRGRRIQRSAARQQDEYRLREPSQGRGGAGSRAASATRSCRSRSRRRRASPIVVRPRRVGARRHDRETLGALKPAFKKDGTVTAGNAPPVNDGAAALVVMSADARGAARRCTPMARIVGQATSGLAPKYLLMTPVEAVRKLSQKSGWRLDDVDLFEINEAFCRAGGRRAAASSASTRSKVNVNGGAVALGHPIGASGARILTTLLYALKQRDLKRGIATLCLGGGNGVALAVERL